MKIFNIRTCFANNSSSSHSIVMIPTQDVGKIHDDYDSQQFGWDNFTLSSPWAKQDYFKQILLGNLYKEVQNADERVTIVKEIFKEGEVDPDGYIDPQSHVYFPNNFDNKLNLTFFKEVADYIVRNPRVVILGGNDNSNGHPLAEQYPSYDSVLSKIPIDYDSSGGNVIVEKFDDYWVLFNRYNGYKVRFSLEDNVNTPTKSTIPELIDIKITDYCPFNCEFCYQGSTINGKHADFTFLDQLSTELAKNKVLEVALGGGEPTLHPQFIEILKLFNSKNIVTNFTTKSLKWLKNPEVYTPIIDNCRSFAYSVTSLKEAQEFYDLLLNIKTTKSPSGLSRHRANIQLVLGTIDRQEFSEILKYTRDQHFNVVLLGFKSTQRGERYTQIDDYYWLFQEIKDLEITKIGMDTIAIQQYEQELKLLEVSDKFYSTRDGAFSCYIDAVKQTIAPNSYCEEGSYSNFKFDTWLTTYQRY